MRIKVAGPRPSTFRELTKVSAVRRFELHLDSARESPARLGYQGKPSRSFITFGGDVSNGPGLQFAVHRLPSEELRGVTAGKSEPFVSGSVL